MTRITHTLSDRLCRGSTALAALSFLWLATPSVAADGQLGLRRRRARLGWQRAGELHRPAPQESLGYRIQPFGFDWVANNHTGTSTLYDGRGKANPLVVTIPGVNGEEAGEPTGIVFSGGTDFVVSDGTKNGPARFLFAGENGTITGWAPDVNLNQAIVAVDRSAQHAVYTGLAIGGNGIAHRLYAANFHSGHVEVFNGAFKRLVFPDAFVDPRLPAGYAPFGIQNVGGDIVVTFAKRLPGEDDEMAGKGLGVVDVFDPDGRFISRVATGGELNAPWGVALAPPQLRAFRRRAVDRQLRRRDDQRLRHAQRHFPRQAAPHRRQGRADRWPVGHGLWQRVAESTHEYAVFCGRGEGRGRRSLWRHHDCTLRIELFSVPFESLSRSLTKPAG